MIGMIFKPCRLNVRCFANQLACLLGFRPLTGILFALTSLLIKETVFFLSKYRLASERQELFHKCVCVCPILECPESEPVKQEWESLVTGLLLAFTCVWNLRCLQENRVGPAPFRVRRVRLIRSADVSPERPDIVRALCKGRSTNFTSFSVMRRIFASGFRAGFVLSFNGYRQR